MKTILFATLVLAFQLWMVCHRRAAAIAGFFILFGLITRTLALVFVDLAGPIYADELGYEVGGGESMPLFACSVLCFLLPLAWMFRPSRIAALRFPAVLPERRIVRSLTFLALMVFMVALYGDMLTRAPIPLFSGIDRIEYNKDLAGPLHPLMFDFNFLLASIMGGLFAYPRLRGADFDFRFLGLYVAALVYFALTGNRFSAFFAYTSFFVIPLAALPMLKSVGRLPPPPASRDSLIAWLQTPAALASAAILLLVAVGALVINSLVNVRGYEDPSEQFLQRSVVQPVELWWTTWNSLGSNNDASQNWDDAFLNPLDPTRNTSIQVLMIKNLGDDRAAELIDNGQQYAGGYPEILFELLGPWTALGAALLFSTLTAGLLAVVVTSFASGRLLTSLLAMYVFFGFSLLFIGGMLNFLLVWTFWAKCGALALIYMVERRRTPEASSGQRAWRAGAQHA
jgi:hypothetical protein